MNPRAADERRRRHRRSGRLLALLLALLAGWGVERFAFCLRTVSGVSMWPMLANGDRLVVARLDRHGVGPEDRWEAFVYEEPQAPGPARVKRLLAVEGETVDLQRGDLFVGSSLETLRRAERSPALVESMLVPVYPGPQGEGSDRWRVKGGRLSVADRRVLLEPDANLSLSAHLIASRIGEGEIVREAEAIHDDYRGDGGRLQAGAHTVPDVRIDFGFETIAPGARFEITHELQSGEERRLRVEKGRLFLERSTPGEAKLPPQDLGPLPPLPLRLRMETLDGRFLLARLEGDGRVVPIVQGPRNTLDFGSYSRVGIRVRNAPVTLARVDISRDVYYVWPEPLGEARQVRSGCAFLVGDNVPASRDCRQHGAIPLNALVGRAAGVVTPWSRRRWLPRPGPRE